MKAENALVQTQESDSSDSERLLQSINDKDVVAIQLVALKILVFSGPVHAIDFGWLMQIILDHGKMSLGWKAAFEHAYERQPPGRRILYRDAMTKLYLWFRDYHMAAKFL